MSANSASLHFPHSLIHPRLGLLVDLYDGARVLAFGIDSRPDSHLHSTGALAPAVTRPELTDIMGYRYHRSVVGAGQGAAAAGELDRVAGQHAGAFGEYQYPDARSQALAADAAELLQGIARLAAVDGDGLEQSEGPAEERHVEQFLLDQLGLWTKDLLQKEGFPGALVIGENHAGLIGNIFLADHFIANTDQPFGQPDGKPAPALQNQLEAGAVRQQGTDDQHRNRPQDCTGGQQQIEQGDAQGHEYGH